MIGTESISRVIGQDVYDETGSKIGSASEVYLDDETGQPEWATVRTGLFGTKESFVPIQDATLDGDRLEVPFSKDKVKHAPQVDHDRELSPADEDELYRYYEPEPERLQRLEREESGGRDTSDRSGDDAMTRSEERLVAHTRTEPTGKARLRKYTVTEEQQVTVPVTREEVRLEQEPAPDTTVRHGDDAPAGQDPEMTLWAERPVVTTEAVPVVRPGPWTELGLTATTSTPSKPRATCSPSNLERA